MKRKYERGSWKTNAIYHQLLRESKVPAHSAKKPRKKKEIQPHRAVYRMDTIRSILVVHDQGYMTDQDVIKAIKDLVL